MPQPPKSSLEIEVPNFAQLISSSGLTFTWPLELGVPTTLSLLGIIAPATSGWTSYLKQKFEQLFWPRFDELVGENLSGETFQGFDDLAQALLTCADTASQEIDSLDIETFLAQFPPWSGGDD